MSIYSEKKKTEHPSSEGFLLEWEDYVIIFLFKTKIFQGCRLPPDAALEDFSSKAFNSSSETGFLKKDLIEDLDWTASVTFIFKFYMKVSKIPTHAIYVISRRDYSNNHFQLEGFSETSSTIGLVASMSAIACALMIGSEID